MLEKKDASHAALAAIGQAEESEEELATMKKRWHEKHEAAKEIGAVIDGFRAEQELTVIGRCGTHRDLVWVCLYPLLFSSLLFSSLLFSSLLSSSLLLPLLGCARSDLHMEAVAPGTDFGGDAMAGIVNAFNHEGGHNDIDVDALLRGKIDLKGFAISEGAARSGLGFKAYSRNVFRVTEWDQATNKVKATMTTHVGLVSQALVDAGARRARRSDARPRSGCEDKPCDEESVSLLSSALLYSTMRCDPLLLLRFALLLALPPSLPPSEQERGAQERGTECTLLCNVILFCSVLLCNVILLCSVMRCDAMRCDAMRCDATRCTSLGFFPCSGLPFPHTLALLYSLFSSYDLQKQRLVKEQGKAWTPIPNGTTFDSWLESDPGAMEAQYEGDWNPEKQTFAFVPIGMKLLIKADGGCKYGVSDAMRCDS